MKKKQNKGTKDKHRLYSSNNFSFKYKCDYGGCDFPFGVFFSIALLSPKSVATSSEGGGEVPSHFCPRFIV
jgi:hypothetical protein